jgi:hypothetical protein
MFANCIKFDRNESEYSIIARDQRDLWDQKKVLLQEAYLSRTSIGGDDINIGPTIDVKSENEIMKKREYEGHGMIEMSCPSGDSALYVYF